MTFPSQEDIQNLFAAQQSGDVDRALRAGYEVNFSEDWWGDEAFYARFKESPSGRPCRYR